LRKIVPYLPSLRALQVCPYASLQLLNDAMASPSSLRLAYEQTCKAMDYVWFLEVPL